MQSQFSVQVNFSMAKNKIHDAFGTYSVSFSCHKSVPGERDEGEDESYTFGSPPKKKKKIK